MYPSFKDALYVVVHQSEVPAKAQAEQLGMSYQMLVNAANPNLEKWHLRGDKVAPITNITRNYALLDYIERSCGRVAFPIPQPTTTIKCLHDHVTRTVAEFGDVLRTFEEIMRDNRLTGAEKLRFEREGYEAIQAIMGFIEAVKRS